MSIHGNENHLFDRNKFDPKLMTARMDDGGGLTEEALFDFRKFLGKHNSNAGVKCIVAGDF